MRTHYSHFKTIVFCFLVLISASAQAQVISEGFEEGAWNTSLATNASATVAGATAPTYNTVTGTINSSWTYSAISIGTAATNYHTGTQGLYVNSSSSSFLCTPYFSGGVTQVTLWVYPTSSTTKLLIGVATDLTTASGQLTSSFSNTNGSGSTVTGIWSESLYSVGVNLTSGVWQQITFTTNIPSSQSAYIKFQRCASGGVWIDDIAVIGAGGTSPIITTSPASITGLSYNTAAATDNTGGNPGSGSLTLTGSNLTDTNPVTVTAPSHFQVSLTGTGGWGATVSVSPSGGSINKVIYVRIDPTYLTVGAVSGNVTFSQAEVASITPVAVSGTIVNLTPIACPGAMSVGSITYSGAAFTWSNVAGNNGYLINVYKTGVKQAGYPQTLALNTTSYNIVGLNQLTAYTATVTVVGNGSTSGNSVECTAQAFTTSAAPPSSKITCMTEDFETLAPTGVDNSSMCPAAGATSNELRFKTGATTNSSCSNIFNLNLSSGTWTNGTLLSACDYDHSSGVRALAIYRGGYVSLPTLDNAKTVTFYVYAPSPPAANSTARGFRLLVDGLARDTGIYVNNVALAISTTTIPSYSSESNGTIRVPAGWQKVSINLNSTTQNTLTIQTIAGNSASDIIIDDVTVECSSMLFTAAPDITGLNYVSGMGPSLIRTFTITGTDLPNASATITLSNLANFEVSLDSGTTWNSTGTASFNYTNYSFIKSVMVRLKAGLAINSYSTTVSFTCPGYTKILPTLSISGKVTLLPQTLPCGEEVTLLDMKASDINNILLDAVTGTNWTATSATKDDHFLLAKMGTLVSPTINLGDYELKNLTFYFQPKSATSMNISLSCFGSGGSFTPVVYSGTLVTPYNITQDLSGTGFSGNFYLQLTDGNQTDVEMWDIKLTGVPKRQITMSTPTLTNFASSSTDCPSQVQSLLVTGTCLDDNSSLDFTSSLYEFSSDGVTWATPVANVSKLTYTGNFPLGGMKVYVRQKGTSSTTAFTANESVTITNGGKGSTSLALSGTVNPPAAMQLPASVAFSSLSGVASIRSIPISGGITCNPLVVSSNCAGLIIANCEGGSYAATATFAADDSLRTIHMKYTPGAGLNCTLTLTSGSYVKTIPITWTGAAAIANGVATDNTAVRYAATAGYGTTNVWKAGALSNAAVVTVASADFDVSMGNPAYGDFVPITSGNLGDFNGTLFIRQKASATSGTITLTTAGGQTTTINVTVF